MHIKPFKATRPSEDYLDVFSSLSFDAELRADLAEKARKQPISYLHIYKPQYFHCLKDFQIFVCVSYIKFHMI